MTLQDLIQFLDLHSLWVVIYFVSLPVLAYLAGVMFSRPLTENGKMIHAVLIYAACVPGLFSLTLCAYSLLLERQSFLEVNIIVYFLPFIAMLITLAIIKQRHSMHDIPGFQRLSGLMFMIVSSFILILILQKMRFWVVFVGSFWMLLLVFVILFAVIKIGWERIISR